MRDSVRPEPVEACPEATRRGPSVTTSPRVSRTLPSSFPRKRESRAGARRGGVSASPTSHTRHRRTGESRYPEVRRAAARPQQPTSQARFEPSPFPLSLSKPVLRAHEGGPPPSPAPACPAHPHRRSRESRYPGQGPARGRLRLSYFPHPPSSYRRKPVSRGAPGGGTPPPTHIAGALRTLSVRPEPVEGPSTTTSGVHCPPHPDTAPSRDPPSPRYPLPMHNASTPLKQARPKHSSQAPQAPRGVRKRSWKYPKTHSCWIGRVVSTEGSFVGDSFPSPQKAH